MQVKALKVFCDVVLRRSFSRAADEHRLSQSAVSQMVHHLEEYLGVRLIDRSKRPFVLTPEGDLFYEKCRKLVQKFSALEDQVRSLHQQVVGRVSVASIYSVGLSHMKQFTAEFRRTYPKATVHIEYHPPSRVEELVVADQVDLGLVSYPRRSRALQTISWREEPMVVVCSPDHPLSGEPELELAAVAGHEMVGFDRDLRIRQKIDRELAGRRVDVSVAVEFDNIETLKRAIEINTGFSILPQPTVASEVDSGTLVAIPLTDPMVRPLGIIHRRGSDLNSTAQRFIAMLQQSEGGSDPASSPDVDPTPNTIPTAVKTS